MIWKQGHIQWFLFFFDFNFPCSMYSCRIEGCRSQKKKTIFWSMIFFTNLHVSFINIWLSKFKFTCKEKLHTITVWLCECKNSVIPSIFKSSYEILAQEHFFVWFVLSPAVVIQLSALRNKVILSVFFEFEF